MMECEIVIFYSVFCLIALEPGLKIKALLMAAH